MRNVLLGLAAVVATNATSAQTVPDHSPAAGWSESYMRTPTFGFDPFRYATVHHWGLVISAGALAENNSLNLADASAIRFIDENDELTVGDAIDIVGLIPQGAGFSAQARAEGGVHLGGPIGPLTLDFSVNGRGTGHVQVDDDLVSILREGNVGRQTFNAGNSTGAGISTVEFGVHTVVRLGKVMGPSGPDLSLGFGGRSVKPVFYASGGPSGDDAFIRVTSDSISSRVEIEALATPEIDGGSISDYLNRGSGIVGDLFARLHFPESGLALEAMVIGLGNVSIEGVERRVATVDVQAPSLDDVVDILFDPDTLSFDVRETVDVTVSVPRFARFAASAWANSILQLDFALTTALASEFETPPMVEAGTTFRFVRILPLRVGLLMGGHQGTGVTAGFGVEGRRFLLRFSGASLGGLFSSATGAAGRFELGFFF